MLRDEYDIENLNPRKNPYSNRVKKQNTINIDRETIENFKSQSESLGIPYQTLINLHLSDCVASKRKLRMEWK
ncbi:BrnA antitoxin family protein [uncultured Acetatifactor sp.]|uniref:BrnA antitoxin family protein n=1 Tax=uncultured Acetatifactor sp. TaxID=1671927 RepID=UPI002FE6D763